MHVPTLVWTLSLVLIVLALLEAGVAASGHRRAFVAWAAGFGASAAGFLLLAVWGNTGHPVISFVGLTGLLAFYVSLPVGMALFLGDGRIGRPRWLLWFLLWTVALTAAHLIGGDLGRLIRGETTSGGMLVFTVEFALLTWVRGQWLGSGVVRTVLGLAALVGSFHLGRLVLLPFFDLTALTYLVNIAFAILWFSLFLALESIKLRLRLTTHAEELERLNHLKDRLLAMTSHDLRGPLGNLQMVWGEVSKRIGSGERAPVDLELVALVDRSLTGARDLLENLFAFAGSQGQADPHAVTDLNLAVATVLSQAEPMAQTKGVELSVERSNEVVVVKANPEPVAAVIRNLLGNAVKFTPAGGRVVARVWGGGEGGPALEVTDTGVGMGPELVAQILGKEARTSRPGTSGERGSGFGLVLVQELVSGWGGTLEVTSVPGKGTRIRVSFSTRP